MSKKMCPKTAPTTTYEIIGYTIPRYHDKTQPYVDFYAKDPETGAKRRKKYTIQGPTKAIRKTAANELILHLHALLRTGWTPWDRQSQQKDKTQPIDKLKQQNSTLTQQIDNYINHIQTTMRPKTIKDYTSKAKILKDYLRKTNQEHITTKDWDLPLLTAFLDHLTAERGLHPRTHNNYRGWLYSLSEYLLQRSHITANPIPKIKKLRTPPKRRQPLTQAMLHQLFTHLRDADPHMLLAVMLEYYTFIRPNELRYIKLRHISYKDMTIYLPAETTKNARHAKVAINRHIINQMIDLNIHANPEEWYLFGPDLKPSATQAPLNIFNKRFAAIRTKLKWSESYQFYSLKDSGIRDLSQTAGIVTARDQARHADISTTNKYLQGHDLAAPEAPKTFTGHLK